MNKNTGFYDIVLQTTLMPNGSKLIFMVSDFSGYVGQHPGGFQSVYGGYGVGSCNGKGTRPICKTNFRKSANHLTVYQSSGHPSQIDYSLTRKQGGWLLIKTFLGEECILQCSLVISNFRLQVERTPRSKPTWKSNI